MRLAISVILSLFAFTLVAQPNAKEEALALRIEAKEHIKNLKDGVLLIRLQNRSKSLETLREHGLENMAIAEEKKLAESHVEIAQAFQEVFTFCPVYFFYSSDSEALRNKQWEQLQLLGFDLKPDSGINIQNESIYVAEFGRLQDESEGFYGSEKLSNSKEGATREKVRYTSEVSGFSVLVIKNDQIRQLRRPFPYYVKTYDSVFFRRSKRRSVQLLQENLLAFYKE